MRLFIIGNGFDLDHDLPTSYKSFRCYLSSNYGACEYLPEPNITQLPDGTEISDIKTDAQILYRLIENIESNESWGKFEEDLGFINYDELVDLSWNDDDDNVFHKIYNNEDMASSYKLSFSNFSALFSNWISSIRYNNNIVKNKYRSLFSNNDLYLTFNYTKILEAVYTINPSQICHIHGKVGETLIFGHRNDKAILSDNIMYGNADIVFSAMHKNLYKDVEQCITKNNKFFNGISNVDEIFFIGWSMSSVDKNYIDLLKEKIGNKNIVIHFTKYAEDNNEIGNYLKKLSGLNYVIGKSI